MPRREVITLQGIIARRKLARRAKSFLLVSCLTRKYIIGTAAVPNKAAGSRTANSVRPRIQTKGIVR